MTAPTWRRGSRIAGARAVRADVQPAEVRAVPRPSRPWFRVYVEAFADPKIRRLTPPHRWLWIAILGAARQSCVPGLLLIAPGVPMTRAELAAHATMRE